MPNRILKESICRSDEIDSLSWFEECLFYRLIVNCDDYGRFDGREKIINSICFPLKDIRDSDLTKALDKLCAAGLVRRYKVQGRPVLQLVTWERHQQIRAKKSKYPAPDGDCFEDDETCNQLISSEIKCPRNPIQSNTESESESESVCSEQRSSEQAAPPIITLQLNTGGDYGISQADIDGWKQLYPNVDVLQELRKMKGWCDANPKRRKTKTGIKRFINSWLAKEQDKGPRGNTGQGYQKSGATKFSNFPQREYDYDALERMLLSSQPRTEGDG